MQWRYERRKGILCLYICTNIMLLGPCEEKHANWYYSADTRECTAFSYGGCQGNANRFETSEQCDRQCGNFRDQDVCSMDKVSRHLDVPVRDSSLMPCLFFSSAGHWSLPRAFQEVGVRSVDADMQVVHVRRLRGQRQQVQFTRGVPNRLPGSRRARYEVSE